MSEKMQSADKNMLSIKEDAGYFGIGVKKMRRPAEDNLEFENYLSENPEIKG